MTDVEDAAIPEIPPEARVASGVGGRLRAAREARGVSVEETAAALRLGARQVDALEREDWQALPGNTFVRGFVRNYAEFVQLNPQELQGELEMRLGNTVPDLVVRQSMRASMPPSTPHAHRRDYALAYFGLVFVIVAALIYFFLPDDLSRFRDAVQGALSSIGRSAPQPAVQPAAEPVLPPGTSVSQVINPQSAQLAATPTPTPSGQSAAVSDEKGDSKPAPSAEASASAEKPLLHLSFAKESWVQVSDRRGNVIFSVTGAAGVEKDVDGQPPFKLVVGNAGGVTVSFRGQLVDLAPHIKGDVARLTLE